MTTSFSELKNKLVINMVDGSYLGHVNDVCIDAQTGNVTGFYVPVSQGGLSKLFGSNKRIFIPARNVCRIGVDVILVEVYHTDNTSQCINVSK